MIRMRSKLCSVTTVSRIISVGPASLYAGASNPPDRYRHIGIYAYRVDILNRFVSWPVSDLEATENLEQLRALNNGVKIHVDRWEGPMPAGVDTPEDLEAVRQLLSETR